MRVLSGIFILLLSCATAQGAAPFLRFAHINETLDAGWLRILALYSDWTDMDGTLLVPAGFPIKFGNALPTAVDTNYTIPTDLSIRLKTPSPSQAPRLVFPVASEGSTPLSVTRYTLVPNCIGQAAGTCVRCGSQSYRVERLAGQYKYGPLEEPIGMMYAAMDVTVSAATGFRTSFGLNDSRLAGWDVQANGGKGMWKPTAPSGTFANPGRNMTINLFTTPNTAVSPMDSARLYTQELRNYRAFSSDVYPEGFLLPKSATPATFQAELDRLASDWKAQGCPTGDSAIQPYLTIAGVISNNTNAFYTRNARPCKYVQTYPSGASFSQEVRCGFDDVNLHVILSVANGLDFLDSIKASPPPPPPPPSPSPRPPPRSPLASPPPAPESPSDAPESPTDTPESSTDAPPATPSSNAPRAAASTALLCLAVCAPFLTALL